MHVDIIGRDEDLCCRLVREHLASLRRRVSVLAGRQTVPGSPVYLGAEGWSAVRSSGTRRTSRRIRSDSGRSCAVLRHRDLARRFPDEGRAISELRMARSDARVHSKPVCPVVNRPGPELWYRSALRAPELVSLVPDLTFRLPRTMVATCFEEARRFFDLAGGRIYYSPLTVPSDYLIDTEQAMQKLERLSEVLPLHLSEVIAGEPVDATWSAHMSSSTACRTLQSGHIARPLLRR